MIAWDAMAEAQGKRAIFVAWMQSLLPGDPQREPFMRNRAAVIKTLDDSADIGVGVGVTPGGVMGTRAL